MQLQARTRLAGNLPVANFQIETFDVELSPAKCRGNPNELQNSTEALCFQNTVLR